MQVEMRHRYVSDSGSHATRYDDDTPTALASTENEGWPACSSSGRIDAAPVPDTTPREPHSAGLGGITRR